MEIGTKPSAVRRLPRARITLPMFGLVAAALVAGPLLKNSDHPDEAAILGMASEKGIVPAEEHPGKGTKIYQWDPELRHFDPFYIGAVIDADYTSHGHRYTLVKRPQAEGLFLAIHRGDMRYWVQKP